MLQQTQVDRVCVKYPLFIKRFPSLKVLAGSSDADILGAWQGLGYNRRALSLKRMAGMVLERFAGKIPDDPLLLQERSSLA